MKLLKKKKKVKIKKYLPFGATQVFVNTINAPFFLSIILFVVTLRAEGAETVLPLIKFKIQFLAKVPAITPSYIDLKFLS
jgi:hypothetical protein